jgi:hypothetical protein
VSMCTLYPCFPEHHHILTTRINHTHTLPTRISQGLRVVGYCGDGDSTCSKGLIGSTGTEESVRYADMDVAYSGYELVCVCVCVCVCVPMCVCECKCLCVCVRV